MLMKEYYERSIHLIAGYCEFMFCFIKFYGSCSTFHELQRLMWSALFSSFKRGTLGLSFSFYQLANVFDICAQEWFPLISAGWEPQVASHSWIVRVILYTLWLFTQIIATQTRLFRAELIQSSYPLLKSKQTNTQEEFVCTLLFEINWLIACVQPTFTLGGGVFSRFM